MYIYAYIYTEREMYIWEARRSHFISRTERAPPRARAPTSKQRDQAGKGVLGVS